MEFWVQGGPAIHMWGVLVYIHVGSIYIILVIRIELYLLLLLLKWLKMGDWNEQIVDPVLPSVNDIVKIEQNTHGLTMLQIYAKAGQLLDPSFLCPYDQCSRYMQY